uniref:Large ribosomal subunit protein bL20c n=1 Tax=Brassica campestris TaxID=3711 RepID=A0A3P6DEA9_BRACM|nr:unnamed protein product [Brassica rapa]
MTQQRIRALVSARRDRGKKKKKKIFVVYGSLTRNAVIHETEVFYSYNRFIHNLYKEAITS